ncbi:NAD(P)H-dependent flavin oxidoreductase [Gemmatimonadota bacterium]
MPLDVVEIGLTQVEIPKLRIGSVTADVPIIQGGMGVRVSIAGLASAVANQGAIGTISSIGLGDFEEAKNDYYNVSREALENEIGKARDMTDGILAVNFMGVLSHVEDLIPAAIRAGVMVIIFGAGIPTRLPAIAPDPEVNLVPIISSARVAELISRTWDRRFDRIPDAFILEGPLAGGHLGFTPEQLDHIDDYSLEILLPEVLEAIKPFEDKHGRSIPIIVAGGIYTGGDIARMLAMGASGVQMGTRFVVTEECDVSPEFKQRFIEATEEDIVIIKSPVGLPGRAIRNKLVQDLENGVKIKITCPYQCLTACHITKARFCIAKALTDSWAGDVDDGLMFCGSNVHRVDTILTVKELIDELMTELAEA